MMREQHITPIGVEFISNVLISHARCYNLGDDIWGKNRHPHHQLYRALASSKDSNLSYSMPEEEIPEQE